MTLPKPITDAIDTLLQSAEPPTDAEVEALAKEARMIPCECGLLYSIDDGDVAKAVALMRRARATGSLERLRERVQKTIDVTPRSALLGMLLTVRDWIDEERGAGR